MNALARRTPTQAYVHGNVGAHEALKLVDRVKAELARAGEQPARGLEGRPASEHNKTKALLAKPPKTCSLEAAPARHPPPSCALPATPLLCPPCDGGGVDPCVCVSCVVCVCAGGLHPSATQGGAALRGRHAGLPRREHQPQRPQQRGTWTHLCILIYRTYPNSAYRYHPPSLPCSGPQQRGTPPTPTPLHLHTISCRWRG